MEDRNYWDSFSESEKQENIQYMLNNAELENVLQKWKNSKETEEDFLHFINAFIKSNDNDAGLIVAVKSNVVKPGVDNIEFLTGKQHGMVQTAATQDGKAYAMVFTSKERFQKCCNDLSGIIMFMEDVFVTLEKKEELDGIVINAGAEEIILDKMMVRAIISVFNPNL